MKKLFIITILLLGFSGVVQAGALVAEQESEVNYSSLPQRGASKFVTMSCENECNDDLDSFKELCSDLSDYRSDEIDEELDAVSEGYGECRDGCDDTACLVECFDDYQENFDAVVDAYRALSSSYIMCVKIGYKFWDACYEDCSE